MTIPRATTGGMHPLFTGLMIGIWLTPVWHVVATFAVGIVGYFLFGHWPKPYIDDPSGEGFAIQAASAVWALSFIALLSTVIPGLIGTPVFLWRRGRHVALLGTVAYFGLWCLVLLFARDDPFRIGDWIMD